MRKETTNQKKKPLSTEAVIEELEYQIEVLVSSYQEVDGVVRNGDAMHSISALTQAIKLCRKASA